MRSTKIQNTTVALEECVIERYDILLALMESSQSQDNNIKIELSKLLRDITMTERETRQYINTVNVKVSGNEKLLEYIQKLS